jgi:hypothetical protein
MSEPASFPRGGQIWEVMDGCDAHIQFLFTAPITFSGSCRLTAGERVCIIAETTDPQPVVVSFLPVRYDELHDSLVPADIRDTPRYKRFMLSVKTGYFYEHFRLIKDLAEQFAGAKAQSNTPRPKIFNKSFLTNKKH